MNQFTKLVSALPCLSVHSILITCCTQANSWFTLEDMLIGGVVVYLSVDRQAAALSTSFSGSELERRLLDKYGVNVNKVLDWLAVDGKYICFPYGVTYSHHSVG